MNDSLIKNLNLLSDVVQHCPSALPWVSDGVGMDGQRPSTSWLDGTCLHSLYCYHTTSRRYVSTFFMMWFRTVWIKEFYSLLEMIFMIFSGQNTIQCLIVPLIQYMWTKLNFTKLKEILQFWNKLANKMPIFMAFIVFDRTSMSYQTRKMLIQVNHTGNILRKNTGLICIYHTFRSSKKFKYQKW